MKYKINFKIFNTLRGNPMKEFIVYQMQIDSEEINGVNRTTKMSTLVRRVKAKTQEEAIGKFVLESNTIPAIKKLNVECIPLDLLKTI
jgi:hypothetical protein